MVLRCRVVLHGMGMRGGVRHRVMLRGSVRHRVRCRVVLRRRVRRRVCCRVVLHRMSMRGGMRHCVVLRGMGMRGGVRHCVMLRSVLWCFGSLGRLGSFLRLLGDLDQRDVPCLATELAFVRGAVFDVTDHRATLSLVTPHVVIGRMRREKGHVTAIRRRWHTVIVVPVCVTPEWMTIRHDHVLLRCFVDGNVLRHRWTLLNDDSGGRQHKGFRRRSQHHGGDRWTNNCRGGSRR